MNDIDRPHHYLGSASLWHWDNALPRCRRSALQTVHLPKVATFFQPDSRDNLVGCITILQGAVSSKGVAWYGKMLGRRTGREVRTLAEAEITQSKTRGLGSTFPAQVGKTGEGICL